METAKSENMFVRIFPGSGKKRLLDAKDAASYLSISRAKLYQWVDAGKIPSVRIDKRRLFDILELDEFVEKLKYSQRKDAECV